VRRPPHQSIVPPSVAFNRREIAACATGGLGVIYILRSQTSFSDLVNLATGARWRNSGRWRHLGVVRGWCGTEAESLSAESRPRLSRKTSSAAAAGTAPAPLYFAYLPDETLYLQVGIPLATRTKITTVYYNRTCDDVKHRKPKRAIRTVFHNETTEASGAMW
jgi:hypothetical protein